MLQKSFEEQLKDKTIGFALNPKEGLWEEIQAQLFVDKRKRGLVLWAPVISAILFLCISLIYISNYKNTSGDSIVSSNPIKNIMASDPSRHKEYLKPAVKNSQKTDTLNKVKDASTKSPKASGQVKLNYYMSHGLLTDEGLLPERDIISKEKDISYSGLIGNDNKSNPELVQVVRAQNILSPEEISLTMNTEFTNRQYNIVPDKIPADSVLIGIPFNSKPKDSFENIKNSRTLSIKLSPPSSKRRFMDLLVTPVLSNSKVRIKDEFKDSISFKNQLNERRSVDRNAWNFGICLQAGVEIKRFNIFAGLYYQTLSYKVSVRNINSSMIRGTVTGFAKFDYNATDSFSISSGNIQGNGENYVTNRFRYLSIPLGLTYKLKNQGKLQFGVTLITAPQFLLSYKGLLYQQESGYYVKQRSAAENHLSRMNLMLNGGLELNYRIGNASTLIARPLYGISLFPAEKAAIRTSLNFWTFSFGYRRNF